MGVAFTAIGATTAGVEEATSLVASLGAAEVFSTVFADDVVFVEVTLVSFGTLTVVLETVAGVVFLGAALDLPVKVKGLDEEVEVFLDVVEEVAVTTLVSLVLASLLATTVLVRTFFSRAAYSLEEDAASLMETVRLKKGLVNALT